MFLSYINADPYEIHPFTLVDNNTWNNSHIALVGKAMSSNESAAYDIMTELDVDYVLGKGHK